MESEGRGEFPTVIAAAHELKSPLSLIRQLSLLLDSDVLSDKERIETLSRIQLTTQKALRLTSDLTRAYNLDDATLFPLEPLSAQQVCREVVYDMTPYVNARERHIDVKMSRQTPLVVGNAELLGRILANFIDNALNYTYEDQAIILRLRVMRKSQKVRLELRDYGPAVQKNYLKIVKRSLATPGESVHNRPESSGLGLYIVSRFAELMYAKTGVIRHSDGATFYVDMPISTQLKLL